MSLRVSLLVPLLLCAPAVYAQDVAELAAMTSPWSGSGGELGFASARGNSNTESFNGRLRLRYTDDDWVHSMALFGLHGFVIGPIVAAMFIAAWDLFATASEFHTE